VQAIGQDSRQSGFSHPDGAFNGNGTRRLKGRGRLGRGRRGSRHGWEL
jgi:hypothetical protein